MQAYRFNGTPRVFAHVLGTAIVCLICADVAGLILRYGFGFDTAKGLIPLFDLNTEANIPTFFSVLMALFRVVLLAIVGLEARHRASPDARYWLVLAAGFLFIAYDEAFQVHEKMTQPMQNMLGNGDLGFLHYAWVVPAIAAVLVATLFFFKFLVRLPRATALRLLTAGALYLGGCIGIELISGNYFTAHGYSLGYNLLVIVEEGMEMAGLATLIHALVSHIAESGEKLEFDLHADQQPAPVLPVVQPKFN